MSASDERADVPASRHRTASSPLYWRLLRLKHIHPNGWQRALLVEGVFGVAAVLTLADVATAWTLVVLPLAVAAVVKLNDLIAGMLAGPGDDGGVGGDDGVRRPDDEPPRA